MGASLYGCSGLLDYFEDTHVVAVDQTLFDIEDGNQPFGGYGEKASHIYFNNILEKRPILISAEISNAFGKI